MVKTDKDDTKVAKLKRKRSNTGKEINEEACCVAPAEPLSFSAPLIPKATPHPHGDAKRPRCEQGFSAGGEGRGGGEEGEGDEAKSLLPFFQSPMQCFHYRNFTALPDTILFLILSWLDGPDLTRAMLLCRDILHTVQYRKPSLWGLLVKQKWGELLPLPPAQHRKLIASTQERLLFAKCYASDKKILERDGALYTSSGTLMVEGPSTPLCLRFDSNILYTGHIDRTIRVFDLDKGVEIAQLTGHGSWVKALTLSSRMVISGSYDGSIRVWDRERNGKLLMILCGHGDNGINVERSPQGSVICLDVSKDSRRVISGSNDTTIRLWNVEHPFSSEEVNQSGGSGSDHVDNGSSSGISGSIRSGGDDVEPPPLDRCLAVFGPSVGHTRTVRCVQLDEDCNRIYSGGSDKKILLWDIETQKSIGELNQHKHRVSCLQARRNALISGSNDKTLRLFDLRTRCCCAIVGRHARAARRLQFDDVKLVSGGDDDAIRVWDLRMPNCAMRSSFRDEQWSSYNDIVLAYTPPEPNHGMFEFNGRSSTGLEIEDDHMWYCDGRSCGGRDKAGSYCCCGHRVGDCGRRYSFLDALANFKSFGGVPTPGRHRLHRDSPITSDRNLTSLTYTTAKINDSMGQNNGWGHDQFWRYKWMTDERQGDAYDRVEALSNGLCCFLTSKAAARRYRENAGFMHKKRVMYHILQKAKLRSFIKLHAITSYSNTSGSDEDRKIVSSSGKVDYRSSGGNASGSIGDNDNGSGGNRSDNGSGTGDNGSSECGSSGGSNTMGGADEMHNYDHAAFMKKFENIFAPPNTAPVLAEGIGVNRAGAAARVSALQFDATRLVVSFTLGYTTPQHQGQHVRRGCIQLFDFADMQEVSS